jgi:excinuclease ABC subunit B
MQPDNQPAYQDYTNPYGIVVAEALIRPTGLLDPEIIIMPVKTQVDDVLERVRQRVKQGQRVLITTLTKKFAEELDIYFKEINIKSAYIHSDVQTIERIDILADLRRGRYDVLIGINLLREGLDLPEVSLVAIFDADKEGFLRSRTSLIQIIGRAARHSQGQVVMYADNITKSMREAIDETERRRAIQMEYNRLHNITPTTTVRKIQTVADNLRAEIEKDEEYGTSGAILTQDGFIQIDKNEKKTKLKKNPSVHGAKFVPAQPKMQARQVYASFEELKMEYITELKNQKLSKPKLEKMLAQAIAEMHFEKAAAIRDLLEGLPSKK